MSARGTYSATESTLLTQYDDTPFAFKFDQPSDGRPFNTIDGGPDLERPMLDQKLMLAYKPRFIYGLRYSFVPAIAAAVYAYAIYQGYLDPLIASFAGIALVSAFLDAPGSATKINRDDNLCKKLYSARAPIARTVLNETLMLWLFLNYKDINTITMKNLAPVVVFAATSLSHTVHRHLIDGEKSRYDFILNKQERAVRNQIAKRLIPGYGVFIAAIAAGYAAANGFEKNHNLVAGVYFATLMLETIYKIFHTVPDTYAFYTHNYRLRNMFAEAAVYGLCALIICAINTGLLSLITANASSEQADFSVLPQQLFLTFMSTTLLNSRLTIQSYMRLESAHFVHLQHTVTGRSIPLNKRIQSTTKRGYCCFKKIWGPRNWDALFTRFKRNIDNRSTHDAECPDTLNEAILTQLAYVKSQEPSRQEASPTPSSACGVFCGCCSICHVDYREQDQTAQERQKAQEDRTAASTRLRARTTRNSSQHSQNTSLVMSPIHHTRDVVTDTEGTRAGSNHRPTIDTGRSKSIA